MPPLEQQQQSQQPEDQVYGDPVLKQLFEPVNQPTAGTTEYVTKGSLVMFQYAFWMHDPVPLVIVTDYLPGRRVRGVNLHYLTFTYISNLLTRVSTAFSYQSIKGDAYISSSFRTYKWAGISQVKIFNSKFVLQMMTVARTFDPYQIRAIRQSVEQQLQQQIIGKAQESVVEQQSFPQQPQGTQQPNTQQPVSQQFNQGQ